MNPPQTYYDWAILVDDLSKCENDAEILAAMQSGTLFWQEGVSTRFVNMLMDVVDDRLNRAVDRFQSILEKGDSNSMLEGIASLRRELIFLRNVVSINAIPSPHKDNLIAHVVNFSAQIQSSLEDSAQNDSTGKLLSTLQNNPVTITSYDQEAI